MAITASTVSSTQSLEEFRLEFNRAKLNQGEILADVKIRKK